MDPRMALYKKEHKDLQTWAAASRELWMGTGVGQLGKRSLLGQYKLSAIEPKETAWVQGQPGSRRDTVLKQSQPTRPRPAP